MRKLLKRRNPIWYGQKERVGKEKGVVIEGKNREENRE